jgi:hypothetical protein
MNEIPAIDQAAYKKHLEAIGYSEKQAEAYAAIAAEICRSVRTGKHIDLLGIIATLTSAGVERSGEWVASAEAFFMPPTNDDAC